MSHNAFINSGLSFLRYVSLSSSMIRNCTRAGAPGTKGIREKALLREEVDTVINGWKGGKALPEPEMMPSYRITPGKGFQSEAQ